MKQNPGGSARVFQHHTADYCHGPSYNSNVFTPVQAKMLISEKKGERERGEIFLYTGAVHQATDGSYTRQLYSYSYLTIHAGLPGIVLAYACGQHKY